MCRWAGIVAAAASVLGFFAGDLATSLFAVALAAAMLWQIWLFRIGVTISDSTVRVQGLVSQWSVPVEAIGSFDVTSVRRPLDQLAREVSLAIHLRSGADVVCRWVGWQDLLSAWFVMGERPLPTPSQERVLERLNAAVAQPR
jgi:hypothetical protein